MRNIFGQLEEGQRRDLERAYAATANAVPLAAAHLRELPRAVKDLSLLLTAERAQRGQPYWASPRLLSAYCRYFLPWNLVRLSYLLPGLHLSLAPGDRILDLGSGPLTLPLALWLAYPAWRAMPLTVVAGDVAPHPLDKGREIFAALAGPSPWNIETRRSTLEAALRRERGSFALITAGNVLNEIPQPRTGSMEERLAELSRLLASRLAPEGRFLAVEPGTRLGGKRIALLRRTALAAGLLPESPCPHAAGCPLLAGRATGWCHFSHSTAGAPQGLLELTRAARLDKRHFSLSCLLLRRARDADALEAEGTSWEGRNSRDDRDAGDMPFGGAEEDDAVYLPPVAGEAATVRILSDAIHIPGREQPARYACTKHGLALVLDAERLPSGAAAHVRFIGPVARDAKTGAYLAEREAPVRSAGRQPQARPAGRRKTAVAARPGRGKRNE